MVFAYMRRVVMLCVLMMGEWCAVCDAVVAVQSTACSTACSTLNPKGLTPFVALAGCRVFG